MKKNPQQGGCRVSPSERAEMEREYVGLHEGASMRGIACGPIEIPDHRRPFGRMTEIQYRKRVIGQTPSYHHPHKIFAQPTVGIDEKGHLHFKSGRYEVRKRGIEDRVPSGQKGSPYLTIRHVRDEKWLNSPPKHLTTLGPLEFIRFVEYNKVGRQGPGGAKTLRFAARTAPVLAHDEHGNLYAVGGKYSIALSGDTMRSRRRHSRHHLARHNPSHHISRRSSRSSDMEHAGKMVATGSAIIVGGTIVAVGLDAALAQTPLSAPAKGVTKIVVALAALAGGSMLKREFAIPSLAILAGAGVDGGLDLYSQYVAPMVARWFAPAPPASQTPAVTPPAPGAQALMPGGLPQGYQAYNRAGCAVGY